MSAIPRSESRNSNPNPDNARIKILLLENIHENAGVCLHRKKKEKEKKCQQRLSPCSRSSSSERLHRRAHDENSSGSRID
jgi:hypothetical protein